MNKTINNALDTPWKIWNEIMRLFAYPANRFLFGINQISWSDGWKLYGVPVIQKHLKSSIHIGQGLQLRSSLRSNPLGPNHPVILCTWQQGASIEIGNNFGMTGGTICAAERIEIGNHVTIGANCTIIDTDFHPADARLRRDTPQAARAAAIVIEDDVFIGMNSLVLKGLAIGRCSVIGAGSVVTRDIPPGVIAAGNPAKVLRDL